MNIGPYTHTSIGIFKINIKFMTNHDKYMTYKHKYIPVDSGPEIVDFWWEMGSTAGRVGPCRTQTQRSENQTS